MPADCAVEHQDCGNGLRLEVIWLYTPFERRKPGFNNGVVCSCASVKAMILANCASQSYLAVSSDVHRRASQFTGSMISGGVCRGLSGEALKLNYETFIHLQD